MRQRGIADAACYRRDGRALTQILRMDAKAEAGQTCEWPAAATCIHDYTSVYTAADYSSGGAGQRRAGHYHRAVAATGHAAASELGWTNARLLVNNASLWPKGVIFYQPDQALAGVKVIFAVVPMVGKRLKPGELDGTLEATAGRIRHWLEQQDHAHGQSEAGVQAHVESLAVDLHKALDHELRTPLTSVAGYLALLEGTDPRAEPDLWKDHVEIITAQATLAIEALERISLAIPGKVVAPQALPVFDAAEVANANLERMRREANEWVGPEQAQRLNLSFRKATDHPCRIQAEPTLFSLALWEVLKNAAAHARTGRIQVCVYTSDGNLIVDIEDDGPGVSEGAEELIFLRFFQDPGFQHLRRGKRGMGLGLFLARRIAESYLGRLTFNRRRGGSLLRFVWPLAASAEQEQGNLPPGAPIIPLRGD